MWHQWYTCALQVLAAIEHLDVSVIHINTYPKGVSLNSFVPSLTSTPSLLSLCTSFLSISPTPLLPIPCFFFSPSPHIQSPTPNHYLHQYAIRMALKHNKYTPHTNTRNTHSLHTSTRCTPYHIYCHHTSTVHVHV